MNFKRHTKKRIACFVAAILLACLFSVFAPEKTTAKDAFSAGYIQTVFNQKNGVGSNEVNCLYQSASGYIWIGTDGGLYRSNGSDFSSINLWDTDKTDVYSINSILQDEKGRVWVGTDNYGLFCIIAGEHYHFQQEYYAGVKTIYDVCEDSDGRIYVSTANGFYLAEGDDDNLTLKLYEDEALADKRFLKLAGNGSEIWGLATSGEIVVFEEGKRMSTVDTASITKGEVTAISVIEGQIYVGTSDGDIIVFDNPGSYRHFNVGLIGISDIMKDQNGRIWVGGENGIGYLVGDSLVSTGDFLLNSYITDILQDYEGNYWIATSRMGVLFLSKSKFTDYNAVTGLPESIVNCVFVDGSLTYVGTDNGLKIYDSAGNPVNNKTTEALAETGIRDICKDANGVLWIAASRYMGVIRVDTSGEVKTITGVMNMPSRSINTTLALRNGDIAVGTEKGMAFVSPEGEILDCFDADNPMFGESILCLYEDEDGNIYAGTDGWGLYVFREDDAEHVRHYTVEDGLNSDVITAITEGENGLFLSTDSGLCFFNETFRALSNIEYSNNIYDIKKSKDRLWIVSSMGVLSATEQELLGSEKLPSRYFSTSDGLSRNVNPVGNSFIDARGVLYVCCNEGLYTLDTENIPYNKVSPKVKVTSVEVDGEVYEFAEVQNGLTVKSDTSRITINFAVFSFSNRDNVNVSYSLSGFDQQAINLRGDEPLQAVYTNLKGGEYFFEISAENGDGVAGEETVSFAIIKEKSLFENRSVQIAALVLIIMVIIVIIIGITHVNRALRTKNRALEELSKEHAEVIKSSSAKNDYLANISNEIKTPVNAMMAKADEVVKSMGEDATYTESVRSIYEIGEDILSKVDDIILLAKIEAGSVEAKEQPYSIASLIYEVSENAIAKLQEKNVKFLVEIGDCAVDSVIGDYEILSDILRRLCDNAVKYTKQGSITLSVDCFLLQDEEKSDVVNVIFSVTDTGIGIQEDRLPDIFEVYNIADNKKKNNRAGNGADLAIVKGYTDIVGGDVTVESVYGAGSTFTLSVYQKIADSSAKITAGEKIEGTLSKEIAESMWLPEVEALVVEADEVSLEVSKKALTSFEMKVDTASTGLAAIDMVLNHDYDVVFIDLSMPVMSGTDTMKEIRDLSDLKYQTLPIIAINSDAIQTDQDSLIEAGFTDSILKPMEVRRLAAILKDCLPETKISEKTGDIADYIENSRYGDGLVKLTQHFSVEDAIRRIGGSIEVYNRLIMAFYHNHKDAVADLKKRYEKDKHGFKMKLHTLRMASHGIGADMLSGLSASMETALSMGDRNYVSKHMDAYMDELSDVLLLLEDYENFAGTVSGMTDEEYAKKVAEERSETEILRAQAEKEAEEDAKNAEEASSEEELSEEPVRIDIECLDKLSAAAASGDFETATEQLLKLSEAGYQGEDRNFVLALADVVKEEDAGKISEMVNTYKDLML